VEICNDGDLVCVGLGVNAGAVRAESATKITIK